MTSVIIAKSAKGRVARQRSPSRRQSDCLVGDMIGVNLATMPKMERSTSDSGLLTLCRLTTGLCGTARWLYSSPLFRNSGCELHNKCGIPSPTTRPLLTHASLLLE